MDIIPLLIKASLQRTNAKDVLKIFGVTQAEELTRPLGELKQTQATAQVINWIIWNMEKEDAVTLRLRDEKESTVHEVELKYTRKQGLMVEKVQEKLELWGKVLHHWDTKVTYHTLSLREIMNSIECAEALNSFNNDIMNAKIDDLVNKAIRLELPECCECCQLNV